MDQSLPTTPLVPSGLSAVQSGATQVSPSFSSDLPRSRKRRFNWRIFAAIAAVAILVLGGIAGFVLTQQNQDLRQQASGSLCSVLAGSGNCANKSPGTQITMENITYVCENTGRLDSSSRPLCDLKVISAQTCVPGQSCNPPGDANRRGICNPSGTCSIQENFCGACNAWFSASTYTCTQIANNGCQLPGTTSPPGGNDNDPSPGQPATASCGGNGEACCDTSNRAACNGSLYCNQNGKCQPEIPGGICGGNQGSGGQLDPNKCIVCDCGSQCNIAGECTLNCRADQDCNAATQALLSGNTCGQVDYQDTNKAYCGVKAIKCDGSCAGGGGGGGGTPTPQPIQCREVIGRIGVPGTVLAEEFAPRIGDDFFLRCRRVAGATSYRFRYYYTNKNNLASLAGSAVIVPPHVEGSASSAPISIDRVGLYYGQCRVCIPNASTPSGQSCSPWEARTGAKRLPYQEGGPFGTVADPSDTAIPALAPSTVDADNDAPRGTIPALRSITEYPDSQPATE